MAFHDHLTLNRWEIRQKLRRIDNVDDIVSGGIECPYHSQAIVQLPRFAIALNQAGPAAIKIKIHFNLDLGVSAQKRLAAIQEDSFHASRGCPMVCEADLIGH